MVALTNMVWFIYVELGASKLVTAISCTDEITLKFTGIFNILSSGSLLFIKIVAL